MRIATYKGKIYAYMNYDGKPLLASGNSFGEVMSDMYTMVSAIVFAEA